MILLQLVRIFASGSVVAIWCIAAWSLHCSIFLKISEAIAGYFVLFDEDLGSIYSLLLSCEWSRILLDCSYLEEARTIVSLARRSVRVHDRPAM